MQVKTGQRASDIRAAVAIDTRVTGSDARADYIARIAKGGGLTLAVLEGDVAGFCCCDAGYFFEKPFVSLLIVDAPARRRGLGRTLLRDVAVRRPDLWTSTNRSNAAMRALLTQEGWTFCGQIEGLDRRDPELFFRRSA